MDSLDHVEMIMLVEDEFGELEMYWNRPVFIAFVTPSSSGDMHY